MTQRDRIVPIKKEALQMERVYNFAPGPSMLALPVLEKAQKDLLVYGDTGMSVMEMSHRSKMYVDRNGDLVMIPRQGVERFIFGSPFGAAGKLDRMADYYRYILPEKGEGYYRTVNVKFDNQIVCKR